MTVSAQTPIKRSTANGVTTVFPYDFKILAAADLEVSLDGVVKTLTTDYTLSGVGDDAGGNVTMLSAPANGAIVVRRRNMAYTREVDYQDQGELPTDTLDDDQDAPILMIQQVAEGLSRAVSLPPESSGVSLELPTPGALQYLRWNAAADALESVLLADVSLISLTAYAQTLLNAVDAAAARLVLGITTFGSSLVTAANAAAARIAMGAAASGANTDITSLAGLTTPLSLAQGGTSRTTNNSMIRLNTGNAYGATNTKIRRFLTTVSSTGSDVTYADSAANAASFTIVNSGVYAISYSDCFNASSWMGISLNSTQLSTNVSAINQTDVLMLTNTVGANQNGSLAVTAYLTAGDVIRPHTDGAAGSGTTLPQFVIVRVG